LRFANQHLPSTMFQALVTYSSPGLWLDLHRHAALSDESPAREDVDGRWEHDQQHTSGNLQETITMKTANYLLSVWILRAGCLPFGQAMP
jgi:hypothetical protein